MIELNSILDLLKEYDAINIIVGLIIYVGIHKKINVVDRAVNQRPEGSKTISQEVSEISHKIDLFSKDLLYLKKEIDEHRAIDERAFIDIKKDIRTLANKI